LTSTLVQGQQTLDRSDTFFGARTIAFDAQRGFLLNGQPYVIKGTCNHQDHAGVGAALPDRLQYFRIAKLKEMGSNAYRTSHNPPTAELLEACDRLGMLVMDENRLLGSDPDNMDRLARLVRRDRNHPSVFMWSIANEEFSVQASPAGKRVASTMQAAIRRLDTTRPITYAAPMGNEFPGINEIIEVRGWNYHLGPDVDAYHQAHPKQPHIGTEQASTLCTRGIYANDTARGYVCAYDVNYPPWGNNAEDWWTFYQARPWLSGGFVWTGFDYRGEPTPYAWPCISSHFGIFDTCGFPKDNFWYYRSWWQDEPVLHILPHWNWFGHDGQEIEVRALSNCDEVELFLNGVSLGKQTMPRNSQLSWKVKYAPGTLSAKGYKGGRVVAEDKVESTGAAAAVQLLPDRPVIDANGEDLSIVTVAVTDEQGRTVPTAGDLVSFEVEGPGRILGVGNGDPSCHEPDKYFAEPAFRSVAVSGWRTKAASGTVAAIPVEATEGEIDAAWTVAGNGAGKPQVEAQQRVFFRTHLTLTAEETAAPVIELLVGKLDGESTLFVNGQKVGLSPDGRAPAVYDVKKFLKTGDNIVTVLFNNYNMFTTGWVDEVALRLQQPPLELKWSRSVFNGLAQVIVQATKEPGEIRLNARAGALKGAAVTIQSKATAARPCVP
jgi:beta-galactosidase